MNLRHWLKIQRLAWNNTTVGWLVDYWFLTNQPITVTNYARPFYLVQQLDVNLGTTQFLPDKFPTYNHGEWPIGIQERVEDS